MNDGDCLLRAILEQPADDGPRLIYADWLDEHAVDAVCTDCHQGRRYGSDWINCPCRGTGRVSDGRRELAEFVRVQCELARLERWLRENDPRGEEGSRHPTVIKVETLRRRERELWTERLSDGYVRGYHWFTAPLGFSTTLDRFIDGGAHADRHGPGTPLGVVRRGFVSEVRCTLAAFVGGQPCECVGINTAGEPQPAIFCPTCKGDPAFRTVGLAAELARRHPVERVALTDREPEHVSREPGFDSWQWPGEFGPKGWFPTEEAAVAAMNEWAVAYARAAAGLTAP
jgi:uncharacterized protein (TIGR02996 family)